MSKLRSINTAFWSDTWIERLEPEQKLLFLYLITNEKTNMLGIYESSIRKISFETGLSVDQVNKCLAVFKMYDKVKYIDNHIILLNYMKHQKYNTNMKKSAIDVYNELPIALKVKGLSVNKNNPIESFERLSKGYLMVPKVEVEVEVEDEIEDKDEVEIESEITAFNNLMESYLNDLSKKTHQSWRDGVMSTHKIKDGKLSKVAELFVEHLRIYKGTTYKEPIHKFKIYCANWIGTQIQSGKLSEFRTVKAIGSI
jgi:hypothetical protein